MKYGKSCYYCGAPATSREHAPPKCIYPSRKHLGPHASDYRKNLITVPSCESHNMGRSKDDQYLAVVVHNFAGSPLSFSMYEKKWVPSMLRNDGSLGKRLFSTARDVILNGRETLALSLEMDRVDRVVEHNARALFFAQTQGRSRWLGPIRVDMVKALNRNLTPPAHRETMLAIERAFEIVGTRVEAGEDMGEEFKLARKFGPHPEVFYCQTIKIDMGLMMRLVFFENLTFLARSDPEIG